MREQSDDPHGSVNAGSGSSGETPEVFMLQAHLQEVHGILRKQVPTRARQPGTWHALSARPPCAAAHGRLACAPATLSRARPVPQSKENLGLKARITKAEGELTVLREELQRARDETGRLHAELGRKTASHVSELDWRQAAHQRGDIYAASIFCTRP